jgi:hypothetical protein
MARLKVLYLESERSEHLPRGDGAAKIKFEWVTGPNPASCGATGVFEGLESESTVIYTVSLFFNKNLLKNTNFKLR